MSPILTAFLWGALWGGIGWLLACLAYIKLRKWWNG